MRGVCQAVSLLKNTNWKNFVELLGIAAVAVQWPTVISFGYDVESDGTVAAAEEHSVAG